MSARRRATRPEWAERTDRLVVPMGLLLPVVTVECAAIGSALDSTPDTSYRGAHLGTLVGLIVGVVVWVVAYVGLFWQASRERRDPGQHKREVEM